MSDPHTQPDGTTQTRAESRSDGYNPGDVIGGRYRLTERIAVGGMASVWRAIDEVLTRAVAVKVLLPHLAADPEFVARFRREAVAAARLHHPLIVSIYDTCDEPEAIIMELVEGRTLRDELDQSGFLAPAQAVAIASDVAKALDVAHKAGLVHRDVKPANVLLSGDGQAKVADFGIAKAARPAGDAEDPDLPDLTSGGLMIGTAKYLAPEQVAGGPIDPRTDVYALGALLYEMLCGRAPFGGDNSMAIATARLTTLPERPRSVLRTIPVSLDHIVMKSMATDPQDRYESAAAMWADLQAASLSDAAGGPVEPPTPDATVVGEAPSFAATERSWLLPAGLITVVALALGLAWMLIGGTQVGEDIRGLVERVAPGGGSRSQPLDIADLIVFDPAMDGENDHLLPLALDGDQSTVWHTERYRNRDLVALKGGLGIIIDLGQSRTVRSVEVISPSSDWAAEIRISDGAHFDLAAWSDPIGTVNGADAGVTSIDVSTSEGSHVLFWLTDLGDDTGVRFDLAGIGVAGS